MSMAKVVAPLVGTTAELEEQLSALRGALTEETRRADVLNRIAAAIGEGGGGPPVEAPRRHGSGGRVLQKGLAGELGGEVQLDYRIEGLLCRMRLPMRALEPKE